MYMCMFECTCAYRHKCIHKYTHVCIDRSVISHVHVCTRACVCIFTYAHICVIRIYAYTSISTMFSVYPNCAYIYTHTYTHIYG